MTDRELMQQALEALEAYQHHGSVQLFDVAATALRERLAREDACPFCGGTGGHWEGCRAPTADARQEPVAWGYRNQRGKIIDCVAPEDHGPTTKEFNIPLYTAPQPAREWQGLTDEEIQTTVNKVATGTYQTSDTFARAIEAKLREKNT